MGSKLTLHINNEIIEKIRIYALKTGRSISDITEDLYKKILAEREEKEKGIKTKISKKYKGIIEKENIEMEKIRLSFLREKHIK